MAPTDLHAGTLPVPRHPLQTQSDTVADQLRVIHAHQEELTSSPYSHDALELALAVATSVPISEADESALLWMMLVGSPSSEKTETVLRTKEMDNVKLLDSLTENAFASGYLHPKSGKPPQDLLPELAGKVVIIKDMTTLFSMRDDKVGKVLGDLQSIYDRSFHKHTGTRGAIDYDDIAFSMLCCITTAALSRHHRYLSAIGSRFLTYQFLPLTRTERKAGFSLLWELTNSAGQGRKHKIQHLRHLVASLGNQLLQAPVEPCDIAPHHRDTLERLATLLARGRAAIQYKKSSLSGGYEIDLVQIEEPYRAFQQLHNLARALVRVHGRTALTPHEIELLRRVVLFSMPHDRLQVLRLFSTFPKGFTRDDCAKGIGKSNGRAVQLLKELEVVEIVSAVKDHNGQYWYSPANEFADLIVKPIRPLDHILEVEL